MRPIPTAFGNQPTRMAADLISLMAKDTWSCVMLRASHQCFVQAFVTVFRNGYAFPELTRVLKRSSTGGSENDPAPAVLPRISAHRLWPLRRIAICLDGGHRRRQTGPGPFG